MNNEQENNMTTTDIRPADEALTVEQTMALVIRSLERLASFVPPEVVVEKIFTMRDGMSQETIDFIDSEELDDFVEQVFEGVEEEYTVQHIQAMLEGLFSQAGDTDSFLKGFGEGR